MDPATELVLPAEAGIRLVRTGETAAFIAAVGASLTGLVAVDRFDPEVQAVLLRISLAVPGAHFVLALRERDVSSGLPLAVGPVPAEIDLAEVMRTWIAALALQERFIEENGSSRRGVWLTVAWRCGYASESGLRALVERELGKGLREVGFGDLHTVLDRLEALVG